MNFINGIHISVVNEVYGHFIWTEVDDSTCVCVCVVRPKHIRLA
ncbi:hypothetical protein [Clostridium frigoris]|nr:hypothetical protein [Clostridium frigoris]